MMKSMELLETKAGELSRAQIPVRWTRPPHTPADPLTARPEASWLEWEDTVLCTRRDFKATADFMEDVPGLTFANSQVPSFQIISVLRRGGRSV
jgi:hypothetical protein